MTNNAAERALRGIALGREGWLFAGSDRGGERAAFMCTMIGTTKLNDVDPQAWLADVLARIAATPQHRLGELPPSNSRQSIAQLRGCVATALTGGLRPKRPSIAARAISARRLSEHAYGGRERSQTAF